jgi:uncharacterized protein YhjY with autotransporter beta-barrel domain
LIYATVSDRTVTIAGVDQLRARFNANAFSGRVEGGYRFVTPWMGLTPYAAGQFTTFDLPAYTEQALSGANTFALNYASKGVTATRSELGVRTDKSWAMQDAIFTVRGRLAWAHDFNTDRNIAATFQTLPGASFVVDGAAPAHESALTTASAELKWLNGFSLAATFEANSPTSPAATPARASRGIRGDEATSVVDAVDGSSTGTSAPWMLALLVLPRFRGASHADDNDNRFRHCQVGFPGPRR